MPGYRAVPRGGDLAGHGDSGGGSARPDLPGSRYWREDSPVRAGVAVKLAGRQAPGGSPCLHWPPTSIPPPHQVATGCTDPCVSHPGTQVSLGACSGKGRADGPQGVGAQESSPLRSAAGTQRSFQLGRPSGPREPGSRWWGGVPPAGGWRSRAGGVVSAHVPFSRPSSDPPSLSVVPLSQEYGWGGESQSWTEG